MTDYKLKCPECGARMVLHRVSKFFYPDGSPKPWFSCSNFPDCLCTHGAHRDGSPLGAPGNAETRAKRKEAHAIFDKLWQTGKMTRRQAYNWLGEKMGKAPIHIGEQDILGCNLIIKHVKNYEQQTTGLPNQCNRFVIREFCED